MSNPKRDSKCSPSTNQQYGAGAAGFAVALSGIFFVALAIGTSLIGITGYEAGVFRLSAQWTIGFGLLTWFFVWLCPEDKSDKH